MGIEREISVSEAWDIFQKIRDSLPEADRGGIMVADLNSGDYELVDGDDKAALERLLTRQPDAYPWPQWVGRELVFRGSWRMTYPNGYKIIGSLPTEAEIREAYAKERRRIDD